ncbi:MAG TPA: hypothetical protein VJ728_15765 [Candidatus Binataceae bacterium]|nr:hypothetical protein [Candidatus Binataceae bacterium]
MIGKRAVAIAAGAILIVAGISGLALAHGFGGPGGGGHQMWLLAHAAGLNHSQIRSAFENDANLKTDRTNIKTAHDAMMSCIVSGKDCTSQIAAFSTALQTMAQERMTTWQNLFKTAPNTSQAANVYSQLKQLHSEKRQILQSVFGSQGQEGPAASDSAPSVE